MPVEAAHVRILGGGGMGFKPADHDVAPLCRESPKRREIAEVRRA